ncbi:hypothetical protein PybrP1_003618 [[Pythium] brassicae (nom. inval.)]|nr:hypothetical protein PybrP1_003618 [[Pythium] brassicae (nom. inval.)]
MAAAAALLEWQPLLHLQHENYQLREENRALHWQVHELLDWKARAVRHMTTLAPKRLRAQRDIRRATQLQAQLRAVEDSLQERVALEETTHSLEQSERQLAQRVRTLEREQEQAARSREVADARGEALAVALQHVGDAFRVHLETLVAMRETIDSEAGAPQGLTQSQSVTDDKPAASAHDSGEPTDATAIMVTGLTAVSDKCLRWLHEHVAQTLAAEQQRAERIEVQHAELERLRREVVAASERNVASASSDHETRAQAAQLRDANAQLARELAALRARCAAHAHAQTQVGDQVRQLVTEVRQFLRLVRAEIKKKFGYVPDAIAHAASWARVLDALETLERHVRLTLGS